MNPSTPSTDSTNWSVPPGEDWSDPAVVAKEQAAILAEGAKNAPRQTAASATTPAIPDPTAHLFKTVDSGYVLPHEHHAPTPVRGAPAPTPDTLAYVSAEQLHGSSWQELGEKLSAAQTAVQPNWSDPAEVAREEAAMARETRQPKPVQPGKFY